MDARVVDIEVESDEFGLDLAVDAYEPSVEVEKRFDILVEAEKHDVVIEADKEAI